MEVPRFWRLKQDYLHLVVEKDGRLFMRGRECEWDGEVLRFVDEAVYAPQTQQVSEMVAVGLVNEGAAVEK